MIIAFFPFSLPNTRFTTSVYRDTGNDYPETIFRFEVTFKNAKEHSEEHFEQHSKMQKLKTTTYGYY